MKKNKWIEGIKNTLIIFLIVFSIYQFFDLYSDKTLIDIISESGKNEDTIDEYYFKPEKIMISFGDTEYVLLKYKTNQEALVLSYIQDIYKTIFEGKGSYTISNISINDLINERSIILIYNDYDDSLTRDLFNIKNDKLERAINKLEKVIIVPNTKEGVLSDIYFASEDKIIKYEIDIDTTELYGLIDEINLFGQMNIYYNSENTSYSNAFNNITFMPILDSDESMIDNDKKYDIKNPFYITEEEIDEEKLESYANTFFENPNAKWRIEKDTNIILYGDGESTLSIYKEGFVNYTSQTTDEDKTKVKDAIKLCEEKIKEDMYLKNNVKLSSINKIDDTSYVLYYDYYIEGTKIDFGTNIKNKYKINYPLEITIKSNKITSVKEIVLEITKDDEDENEDDNIITQNKEKKYGVMDYKLPLSDLLLNYPDIRITDMKIGYFKENMYVRPILKWIIKTTEGIFTYNLE